jgi:hypothetical protein
MGKIIHFSLIHLQDACLAHRVEVPLANWGLLKCSYRSRILVLTAHTFTTQTQNLCTLNKPLILCRRIRKFEYLKLHCSVIFHNLTTKRNRSQHRYINKLIIDFTMVHHSLLFHTLLNVCFCVTLLETQRHTKRDVAPRQMYELVNRFFLRLHTTHLILVSLTGL